MEGLVGKRRVHIQKKVKAVESDIIEKTVVKRITSQARELSSEEIESTVHTARSILGDDVMESQAIENTVKSFSEEKLSLRRFLKVKDVRFLHGEEAVADYALQKKIGEGGMGYVYLAEQVSLKRETALKLTKSGGEVSDVQAEKFMAEALITGYLDHTNIVPVIDAGVDREGHLFYVMKRVQGVTWDSLLRPRTEEERKRSEKMTLASHLDILHSVSNALAFAHSKNVIHRDLKPANVMIGEFGEVILLDWGVALSLDSRARDLVTKEKTGFGGTACYMAPEMARHDIKRIGKCSDIYLLGALLYRILTGIPPHAGKTFKEVIVHAAKNAIEAPREAISSDRELFNVALKAMAYHPEERYASIAEFQKALREYREFAERKKESMRLMNQARHYFKLATSDEQKHYIKYLESILLYKESIELWAENRDAQKELRKVTHRYVESALKKDDYDLAISVLEKKDEKNARLFKRIEKEKQYFSMRKRRYSILKNSVLALSAGVSVFLVIGYLWVFRNYRVGDRILESLFNGIRNIAGKKYYEAIYDYNRAIELNPDSTYAYIMRGRVYYQKGDYDKALSDFNHAVAISPESVYALVTRGRINYRRRDYRSAIEDYTRVIDVDPGFSEAYKTRGNIYLNTGQYNRALFDYTRAIQMDPDDVYPVVGRAGIFIFLGRYEEALSDCERALEINPRDTEVWMAMGLVHCETGHYEKAVSDFSRAIELKPDFAEAYSYRGNVLIILKEGEKAVSDCSKAVRIKPDVPWLYVSRGIAHIAGEDYEKGIEDFSKALQLQPQMTDVFARKALACISAGFDERAVEYLTEVIARHEMEELAYLARGAVYLFERENLLKAEKDFQRCIDENPADPYGHIWMYILKRKKGVDGWDSLENFEKRLEHEAWAGYLARMLLGKTSVEECFSRAEHANKSREKYRKSEALFYAGQYYLIEGDREKAVDFFKKTLDAGLPNTFPCALAKAEIRILDKK